MGTIVQFHNPELSIWQSAVDEVVAEASAGAQTEAIGGPRAIGARPDSSNPMVHEANEHLEALNSGAPGAGALTGPVVTEGLIDTLGSCSLKALKLAKARILGDTAQAAGLEGELRRFGNCDPLYSIAAAKYAEYYAAQGKDIPYRTWSKLQDFVIDGKLPAKARIAFVGDWGTGQDAAQQVLKQMAGKKSDLAIHLGDIYYSGTGFENQNYFYRYWSQILDLPNTRIPTFTLSGNHDMYCGGEPYYQLIDKLGQPASYFCLRNDYWQFVAIDTGYNDHNPLTGGGGATFLRDTEVAWLTDKINNAGQRKTVLLSHHQLFTAFDSIDGNEINLRMFPQVKDLLPKIALWLWGHEHNFVVYQPYQGLARGRCIGHGAFPVGAPELSATPHFSDVPLVADSSGNPIRLSLDPTGSVYNHGYAIMELDGATAKVSYYQDSDTVNPMFVEFL